MNVLFKFSGEFFTAKDEMTSVGLSFLEIIKKMNISSGYIVVGGGNRVRGVNSDYDRNSADNLGVMSTIMNGFILKESLKKIGYESKVFSHFNDFGEKYDPFLAKKDFLSGKWVILAGGLGKVGFVSTDLNSVIKSLELGVDAMVKVTPVGGVFDKDPSVHKDAVIINNISHSEVLSKKIKVMDLSATAIAFENNLSIGVCSLNNFESFFNKEKVGTVVGDDWR